DHEEFKTVWWSIFRSFMTPMNFFEVRCNIGLASFHKFTFIQILRKRFLGFSAPSPTSSKGRIGIFTILCQWLEKGSGAQDALADNELYMAMKNFLEVTSTPKILANSNVEERASWTEVENARQNSLSLFTLNTRRPKVQYPLTLYSNEIAAAKNFGPVLSSIDDLDPEALVENLDALAAATMRAVTPDVYLF
ncbi:MAG TPA: hypothetical protein VGO47_04745, partial [Chlamydiales bacterium]|nr:hypothetical protein [Chlamydiales bacterium]